MKNLKEIIFTKFIKNKNDFIIIYADFASVHLYYEYSAMKIYIKGLLKDVKDYFNTSLNIGSNFDMDDYEDLLGAGVICPLYNINKAKEYILEYKQTIIPFIILKTNKGKLNLGYILYSNLVELNDALNEYNNSINRGVLCININDVYPLNKFLKKQNFILKNGFRKFIINTSFRNIKYYLNKIFSKRNKRKTFDTKYNIPISVLI